MIEVMYVYGYVLLYTYIHTFSGKTMIMLIMNAKWYPVPTTLSSCLPRSYYAGTNSIQFLLRLH